MTEAERERERTTTITVAQDCSPGLRVICDMSWVIKSQGYREKMRGRRKRGWREDQVIPTRVAH